MAILNMESYIAGNSSGGEPIPEQTAKYLKIPRAQVSAAIGNIVGYQSGNPKRLVPQINKTVLSENENITLNSSNIATDMILSTKFTSPMTKIYYSSGNTENMTVGSLANNYGITGFNTNTSDGTTSFKNTLFINNTGKYRGRSHVIYHPNSNSSSPFGVYIYIDENTMSLIIQEFFQDYDGTLSKGVVLNKGLEGNHIIVDVTMSDKLTDDYMNFSILTSVDNSLKSNPGDTILEQTSMQCSICKYKMGELSEETIPVVHSSINTDSTGTFPYGNEGCMKYKPGTTNLYIIYREATYSTTDEAPITSISNKYVYIQDKSVTYNTIDTYTGDSSIVSFLKREAVINNVSTIEFNTNRTAVGILQYISATDSQLLLNTHPFEETSGTLKLLPKQYVLTNLSDTIMSNGKIQFNSNNIVVQSYCILDTTNNKFEFDFRMKIITQDKITGNISAVTSTQIYDLDYNTTDPKETALSELSYGNIPIDIYLNKDTDTGLIYYTALKSISGVYTFTNTIAKFTINTSDNSNEIDDLYTNTYTDTTIRNIIPNIDITMSKDNYVSFIFYQNASMDSDTLTRDRELLTFKNKPNFLGVPIRLVPNKSLVGIYIANEYGCAIIQRKGLLSDYATLPSNIKFVSGERYYSVNGIITRLAPNNEYPLVGIGVSSSKLLITLNNDTV